MTPPHRVTRCERFATLALLAVTACTAPDPPGVVRADSAGVTVVTHGSSPWQSEVVFAELASEPSVTVGSPETPLFDVRDAEWFGAGIAVANGASGEILVFRGDGSPLAALGGSGDGPEEFGNLTRVVPWGADSIAGFDFGNRTLLVFAVGGAFGRSIPVALESNESAEILGFGLDGLIAAFRSQPTWEPGVARPPVRVAKLGPTGEPQHEFGRYPGVAVFAGEGMTGGVVMGPNLALAAGSSRVAVGDAARPELHVFDFGGPHELTLRWADSDRSLGPDFRTRLLEGSLASLPETARAQARSMFDAVPFADSAAAYRDLLVDEDGNVWVGAQPRLESLDPQVPQPPQSWAVFSPNGEFRGRVEAPAGVRMVRIRRGRVLAIVRDALGIESVSEFALSSR